MTQYLPPNLLAFFAPREPLPFLPPLTKLPHEKKSRGYTGVGQYLSLFEDPKDTPPPIKIETREERLERKKREKLEKAAYIKEQGIALWDPHNNPTSTSDPYKTLFVARVSLDTSESKLKKEFEAFGPVRKVSLITDKITGKPKGYAFVEFENEKDMHAAYKHADGKKIDGRRVLVDVERGRTVKGWLPRRLGGGLSDSKPRVQVREEREEKSFGSRDRFDSRRGAAGDRGDRGRDRSDRRRRSKSRERERDRGSRDRTRDRDRHKDRYERKAKHRHSRRSRDRHVAHSSSTSPYDGAAIGGGAYEDDYERKPSIRGLSDSESGSTRKHRSRSKDRSEKKRSYARSRSRSPSQDRKRSRYDKNGDGGITKHGRHQPYSDSGEMEEGEDRSYDSSEYTRRFHSSSNNNGQVTIKNEDDYEDSFTSQPGYGGYKD